MYKDYFTWRGKNAIRLGKKIGIANTHTLLYVYISNNLLRLDLVWIGNTASFILSTDLESK